MNLPAEKQNLPARRSFRESTPFSVETQTLLCRLAAGTEKLIWPREPF